jgi:hypothetical protein
MIKYYSVTFNNSNSGETKTSCVFGSLLGIRSLQVKVHQEKKTAIKKKNSTVPDRVSDFLSGTVEFFFDCGFFSG